MAVASFIGLRSSSSFSSSLSKHRPTETPRWPVACSPISSSSSPSSSQFSLSPLQQTLTHIHSSGVIACLHADSAELAMEAANAALSGGISVLEIMMSTPGVFEVLQRLMQEHPSKVIGVGTVLNAQDAKNVIAAGAKFFMSPAIIKGILDELQDKKFLYIPGVMTPTEILSAYNAGAKIVKVYPVSALGGLQYISALNKPFSHIPMVASQGITIDSVREYIACGASSVVLSDAIFDKEAMSQRNFSAIYKLAKLAASLGSKAVERRRVLQEQDLF